MKSFADRKIIERIVPVKVFDRLQDEGYASHVAKCRENGVTGKLQPQDDYSQFAKCGKNYGYIMPIYAGWDWAPTKKKLIERYT